MIILVLLIATALAFDFTNGFHDTGNAMATSIATNALKPKTAVILAGLLNLVGAFLSVEVAITVTTSVLKIQDGKTGSLLSGIDPSTGPGHGEARLVAKQWGTAVTLQAWELPAQGPFELEIVGAGKSECAAVWGLTKDGHAIVTGATSLQRDDITSITVKGAGDVVLMGH